MKYVLFSFYFTFYFHFIFICLLKCNIFSSTAMTPRGKRGLKQGIYNHCSIIAQEAEKSNAKGKAAVGASRGSFIIYTNRRCELFIVLGARS